ncbi:hypothetical protein [Microvirga yunnanensis]|uniref:hypothetical protein n=1 Tax=Microvirga yunnanensis TaxID=2953740 RepID=UPI0021C811E3|nr:hypothetical protein [Microvirga sp. HBU65207]
MIPRQWKQLYVFAAFEFLVFSYGMGADSRFLERCMRLGHDQRILVTTPSPRHGRPVIARLLPAIPMRRSAALFRPGSPGRAR